MTIRKTSQFHSTTKPTVEPEWTRLKIQEITLSILTGALEIQAAHGFSYWDSAIIAAACTLGCRELYSEDMSHGREVEGVTILHPFR